MSNFNLLLQFTGRFKMYIKPKVETLIFQVGYRALTSRDGGRA